MPAISVLIPARRGAPHGGDAPRLLRARDFADRVAVDYTTPDDRSAALLPIGDDACARYLAAMFATIGFVSYDIMLFGTARPEGSGCFDRHPQPPPRSALRSAHVLPPAVGQVYNAVLRLEGRREQTTVRMGASRFMRWQI